MIGSVEGFVKNNFSREISSTFLLHGMDGTGQRIVLYTVRLRTLSLMRCLPASRKSLLVSKLIILKPG